MNTNTNVKKITNNDGMYAYLNYAAYLSSLGTIWFMDLYGPTTGVRAIMASFHSGRRLEIGWHTLKKPGNVKFLVQRTALVQGYTRVILFPKPVEAGQFPIVKPLLLEDGKQPWDLLIDVLSAYTIWPVKREWGKALWNCAATVADGPITNLRVLEVDEEPLTSDVLVNLSGPWDEIIQQAMKLGTITV